MRYLLNVAVLFATALTGAEALTCQARQSEEGHRRVSDERSAAKTVELSFGVYTADKATVMYRRFTPILEALEERLEKHLKRRVDLELRIYKTYTKARDALIRGRVDFVRFGPASYVLAKRQNPAIELLAMESRGGGRTFPGYIVVRADSNITKLEELRGKRFAFGDEKSTIGRYLAQEQLVRAGIRAEDLAAYDYLGRHDLVFRAVAIGDFDAGAVKRSTFRKLNKNGKLRILHELTNTTKPWVARAGLTRDELAALRTALLDLTTGPALRTLKIEGFVAAEDRHYAAIRRSMQRAADFESKPAPVGRE